MNTTGIVSALLLCAHVACAQSFQRIDTMYTLPGYVDGILFATIVLPQNPNHAAVICVHELGAARQAMDVWCDTLAARGYLAMTIEYPDPINAGAVYPSPPRAMKLAIQFIRRSAAFFHIDSARIGALGRSLGAGLVGESVTSEHMAPYFGIDSTVSDHLDAAALFYGVYDFANYTQSVLPIPAFVASYFQGDATQRAIGTSVLHANAVTTPILLLHGTNDGVLQYQQSVEFHDSLDAYGKPNTLLLYPNQGHVFELTADDKAFTPVGLGAKDSVLAFFAHSLAAPAAVEEQGAPRAPQRFALAQNFPNPFNRTSAITFSLPAEASSNRDVSLALYDMYGRAQTVVYRGTADGATHTVTVSATDLPPGCYAYVLRCGALTMRRMCAVVR